MRVSVEGGKYTYVITETNAHVLRYGELWKDATGDKFTYCMAAEIESLREQVEKLQADADRLDFLDRNLKFNTGWDVGIAHVGLISVAAIGLRKTTIREAIDNARNGK